MRLRRRLAAACGAILALAGCSARIHKVGIAECPRVTTGASDYVDVRYLGVGGVLLSRKSDVILTAPLYSNPSLAEFAMDHQVRSDPMVIDRLFPPEGKKAQAILVGHSHYDHLLDVPYIAVNLAKDADVYGSQTTVNLLDSIRKQMQATGHDVHSLEAKAADPTNGIDGDWQKITDTMRVRAIRSEHSDQFAMSAMKIRMPLHMFRGGQDKPLAADLPKRPSEWPEGPVFAYLIDFLDDAGKPVFRVYYQDSGANKPIGVPTAQQLKDWGREQVDLALICLGGEFPRLVQHPEYLIHTIKPRYALLIHWEDFFVTQQAACVDAEFRSPPNVPSMFGGMRSTDVARFRKRIREADPDLYRRTWLPCPTASTFRFPVGGGDVSESKTTFDCKPFEKLPR
jgi:hypothetical protein